MTLRKQLFIAISLVFFAIFVGLMFVGISGTRNYLEQQLASHAQDAASSLAHPLSQSMGKGDTGLAETQVTTLFDRGYFQRIAVLAADGTVVVNKELPPKIDDVPQWFSDVLPLQAPAGEAFVSAGWRQLGKVLVISQPTHAYQHLWNSCLETAGWMMLGYVIALMLTQLLLRVILKPLSAIEHSALEIQEKRFGQIGIKPRALELARVVSAMNAMSRKIAMILDTESAKAEALRKEAYQDAITGLDNRRSFDIRFPRLLEGDVDFSDGALIGVEINNFSAFSNFNIEDGHKKGHNLLLAVANAGREVLGQHAAILCRITGVAFGFVVIGLETAALHKLSHDLQDRLNQEFERLSLPDIFYSMGVVPFTQGHNLSHIMARHDVTVESARFAGHNAMQIATAKCDSANCAGAMDCRKLIQNALEDNRWTLAGESMLKCASTECIGSMAWRKLIQNALEENRWTLMGQPVLSLSTGQTIHKELMARLIGIDGHLVPANIFLPMASRHKMLVDIDRAMLSLVLDIIEKRDSLDKTLFAVNISHQSLKSTEFMSWLTGKLNQPGIGGLFLSFEMSEHGCSIDPDATKSFISLVRSHQAKFGIDHFGLDPNSLQLLRDMPPDYIKLNAGLVTEAPTSDVARSLLKSIVTLAKSLDIEVIAQGVERAEQVEMLLQDQVGGGQGYLYGAPSDQLRGKDRASDWVAQLPVGEAPGLVGEG